MPIRALLLVALFLAACRDATPVPQAPASAARATFAGGCFWCMEPPYEELPGVYSVVSGYTGGAAANPTYEQVSGGGTGHYEAVEIHYDPKRIRYEQLLEIFWRNIDPLDDGGQFCDRGGQYRAAVFVHDATQRQLAEESKKQIEIAKQFSVVTPILEAATFHPAEPYHQDFHRRNPVRYRFYRLNCGRDGRLEAVWGKAK